MSLGLASLADAQPATPIDMETIQATDRYLERLELDSIRIKWLERQVLDLTDAAADQAQRDALAASLLQLYSQQMMSPESKAELWLTKTTNLLASFPQFKSPQLEIAMAQASFRRDEQRFHRWWQAGQPAQSIDQQVPGRDELNSTLDRTREQLTANQQKLQQAYDAVLAELQSVRDQKSQLIEQLDRKESELAHADYLLGWTLYLSAIVNPASRQQLLIDSNHRFREFLQIDLQRSLVKLEAKWIDFDSEWQVRALAGLAITESGLGHDEQSQRCFELLESNTISQSSRDLIPTWKLTSRLFVNNYRDLNALYETVSDGSNLTVAGRLTFWKECWSGADALQNRAETVAWQLRSAALSGMVLELDTGLLKTCWDSLLTNPELATRLKDYLHESKQPWLIYAIEGLTAVEQLQSEPEAPQELVDIALRNLQAACQAATKPLDIASCELVLGRLYLSENDPEPAVERLLHAAKVFGKSKRPGLALESQWLAINALSSLANRQSDFSLLALQEIQNLERSFPGSTYAKRARLTRTQLNNLRRGADQSVEALAELTTDETIGQQAWLKIVEIRYGQWLELAQTAEPASRPGDQLAAAQQRVAAAVAQMEAQSPNRLDWNRERIKANLLLVNLLIRSGSQLERVAAKLGDLGRATQNLPTADPLNAEFQYNQLLLNTKNQQLDAALQVLEELRQRHSRSRFYRSGLVEVTATADAILTQESPGNRSRLPQVVGLYEELSQQLGTADETLQASPNARVALTRLVELQLQQGKSEQAISGATKLYRLFPERKSFVRLWATVNQEVGRLDDAMKAWRKLAAASQPGTDDWHEAKFNLATCLQQSGQSQSATDLIEQTLQLSPQMPARWREKFATLQE